LKKTLTTVILASSALLISCDDNTSSKQEWQPTQITADLNRDGRTDLLEFVGVGNDLLGHPAHYQVTASLNTGTSFSAPNVVLRIPHNLLPFKQISIVDVNNDSIPDLLYTIDVGNDGWGNPQFYQVMAAYGQGNGKFKYPIVLRNETNKTN
jgi:hypothetical protein